MVDQILEDKSQDQSSVNVLHQLDQTSQGIANNQLSNEQSQLQANPNKISDSNFNSKIELKDQIQVNDNDLSGLDKLQGVAAVAFSQGSQNAIDQKVKTTSGQAPNQRHSLDLPEQNSTVMRLSIQKLLNDLSPDKRIQFIQQLQLKESIVNHSSSAIDMSSASTIVKICYTGEKFIQNLSEESKAVYYPLLHQGNIEIYVDQISSYSDIKSCSSVLVHVRRLGEHQKRKRLGKPLKDDSSYNFDVVGPNINDPAAAPSPDYAQLQMDLAQIERKYNSPKALIHIDEAINQCQKGTFEHGSALHRKSLILDKMGRFQEAFEYLLQCLKIVQKLPNSGLSVASAKASLVIFYSKLSDQIKVSKYSLEALSYFQSFGYYLRAQMIYTNLGVFYDQKDAKLAYSYHKKALKIGRKFQKNPISYGVLLFNFGRSLVNIGTFQQALNYFQEALAIFQKEKGKDHLVLFHTLNQIAQCYFCTNNVETALHHMKRSLQIYKNALDNVEKSVQKTYIASRYITQIYQLQTFLNARVKQFQKNLGPYRVVVNQFLKDLNDVIQRVKQYEKRMKTIISQESEAI